MKENHVCINVNAPPVDGEANRELAKYISSLLGLRNQDIRIDKVTIKFKLFIEINYSSNLTIKTNYN